MNPLMKDGDFGAGQAQDWNRATITTTGGALPGKLIHETAAVGLYAALVVCAGIIGRRPVCRFF
jgi:hypothetical protein